MSPKLIINYRMTELMSGGRCLWIFRYIRSRISGIVILLHALLGYGTNLPYTLPGYAWLWLTI